MAKRRTPTRKIEKQDGYVNELTGIGDWLQDKTLGGRQVGLPFAVAAVNNQDAEDRWRGSDLGARIVEAIPGEMTREWLTLTIQPTEDEEQGEAEEQEDVKLDAFPPQGFAPEPEKPPAELEPPDDDGPEQCEELCAQLEELDARVAVWTALCYERAYGGSVILIGADDGNPPEKPLDETRIKSVDWLNVFSGGRDGEVTAWSYYTDMRSPKFGKPETYVIRNTGMPVSSVPLGGSAPPRPISETQFVVHESRLMVFPGNSVSRRVLYNNRGWGDSIFTRIDEVLSQYNQTWGGVANIMTDFSQAVLKVPGLSAALSGRNKQSLGRPITTRALQIQQTRSIARMMFIDKEEEFQRETSSIAGISTVLEQFALRLAAAADMPVTLLMGQAPAGLNATGASDVRFFYDRVASAQKSRLMPQLRKLVRLMMLSKDGPTDGIEPEKWTLDFCPLYQLDDMQQAQIRKLDADTDHLRIQDGVLSPEEVAASAYGGSEYSSDRTIDLDTRAQMSQQQAAAGVKPMSGVQINPSAAASVMKVNEARAASGLGPLTNPDGTPNPDGELFMSEYVAKNAKTIGQAVQVEAGDPTPDMEGPGKGAPGGKPPGGAPPFGKGKSEGAPDGEKKGAPAFLKKKDARPRRPRKPKE